MSYGSQIEGLNSTLQSLSTKAAKSEEDTREDLINKSRDVYNRATEKLRTGESISGETLASSLGVTNVYNQGKKIIKAVRKVRDSAQNLKNQFQGQSPEEVEPEPEISQGAEGKSGSSVSETSFSTAEPRRVGNGYEEDPQSFSETLEDPAMEASTSTRAGDSLREAGFSEKDAEGLFEGGDGETADLSGTSGELAEGVSAATDAVASTAGTVGEEALGAIAGAQVLDAVPILGEATAAIGAIAGIGEGIASLVDHKSAPSAPAPVDPRAFLVGSDVQQRYASMIPTHDTSIDRGSGSGVF